VLQALLAPASTAEGYYRQLLKTARAAGLEDSQVLLGLLWHAPLGNSHHHPRRAEYLLGLVKQALVDAEAEEVSGPPPARGEGWQGGVSEDLAISRQSGRESSPAKPGSGEFTLPAAGMPTPRKESPAGQCTPDSRAGRPGWRESQEALNEMWRFSHDNLIVERCRYEAMIYELGKLGALNDFFKREHRQNKALREKLESQWTKELDYLRQLAAKKTKKGWYRSWRQE
jgi:hypothetical protein